MNAEEYQDQLLVCADCGSQFTFTAREQAFYKDRGFISPRRCKTCRDKRKSAGMGVPIPGAATGGPTTVATPVPAPPGAQPGRQYYKVVCAACGVETTVPFKPDPNRPAYCRKCYVSRRKGSSMAGGSMA
jgi:CxxC-x17-CxxC domain-containing protein